MVDRDEQDGRAFKCTFCYDRQHAGLEPACAKACPAKSIQFGELENLRRTARQRLYELESRSVRRNHRRSADRAEVRPRSQALENRKERLAYPAWRDIVRTGPTRSAASRRQVKLPQQQKAEALRGGVVRRWSGADPHRVDRRRHCVGGRSGGLFGSSRRQIKMMGVQGGRTPSRLVSGAAGRFCLCS